MDMRGRTVLFSGGISTLDGAIRREIEQAGADLILHDVADSGGRGTTAVVEGEIASASGAVEVVARAWQLHGRLDATVIHAPATPLGGGLRGDEGSWTALRESELKGPFFLARAAGLRMAPGGGRLVFVVERAQDEAPGRSAAGVVAAGLLTVAGGFARALRPAVSVATLLLERSADPSRTTDDQEAARTVRLLLTECAAAKGAVIGLGMARRAALR